jgi:hypothetical protein
VPFVTPGEGSDNEDACSPDAHPVAPTTEATSSPTRNVVFGTVQASPSAGSTRPGASRFPLLLLAGPACASSRQDSAFLEATRCRSFSVGLVHKSSESDDLPRPSAPRTMMLMAMAFGPRRAGTLRLLLALGALVGVLASGCAHRGHVGQASNPSTGASALGDAQATIHGIPIPADARPLPKASLSTPDGGVTETVLLPSTVPTVAVRAWYAHELPAGKTWPGLNECTNKNNFSVTPAVIIFRSWAGTAGQLLLDVTPTGSGSWTGITVQWNPASAGRSGSC